MLLVHEMLLVYCVMLHNSRACIVWHSQTLAGSGYARLVHVRATRILAAAIIRERLLLFSTHLEVWLLFESGD